jgi:hypothetical protein
MPRKASATVKLFSSLSSELSPILNSLRTARRAPPEANSSVMLSGALQRNAKHEARLSNISDYSGGLVFKDELRFFASLRMTLSYGFRGAVVIFEFAVRARGT